MFKKISQTHRISLWTLLLTFFFLRGLLAQTPNGYYNAATGKTGPELKEALNNIIKNHTEISYSAAYDALEVTDRDSNNSANVTLFYSGWSRNAAQQYNNGAGWNREHVWAKSHGDFGTTMGAGTDLHHLRAADVSTNSARGNKDFDNGGTRYIDGDGATDCFSDADSWEPRDAVKGDVARMIFYMAVRYEGENGEPDLELVDQVKSVDLNTTGHGYHGKLSTLLEWNTEDPVDNWERRRNDIIYYNYQHNRNPFIDHPEFVALIWSDNPPPFAPSDLTASDITQTSLTLIWTDNSSDENGFIIYKDGAGIATINPDSTRYPVTGLSPGTDYHFTVTAFNTGGESVGASLTVSTLPADTNYAVNDSIFFSEYIEGSGYNKALEIFNASGQPTSLENIVILSTSNYGDWNTGHYEFPEGTLLGAGEVFVIMHSSADGSIHSLANELTSSTVVNFNGNDVRALAYIADAETTIIDIIGLYEDPDSSSSWPVAGVDNATVNHTLIRKSSVFHGNSDWLSSAGTNTDDSEWIVLAKDNFDNLGSHTVDAVNTIASGHIADSPADYRLYACFPNPFNPVTTIRYEIRKKTTVNINVFDIRGNHITSLVRQVQQPGLYSVIWNGKDASQHNVPGGVYLYQLQTDDGFTQTGKMVLIK